MPLSSTLIDNTIAFVKEELAQAEGGHDWFHIERVYKTAMRLAKEEQAEPQTVALAALLHDIADAKFHDGDESLGPKKAAEFLKSQNVDPAQINAVVNIIEHMSFKNSFEKSSYDSLELRVVRDADRLDAIGAIGIARAFNYGGFKNRALYDPEIEPQLNLTKEQYKKSTAPTINHFYEKLLLLQEMMHTKTGRQMAAGRHEFMKAYLSQFYKEWEGEL
ncbi:HD domain-containing protein [Gilvibacter sediminis]|uniref:HD domain-containing protein n=1 Tax=Gilvibacter sediminis TaxID=379071 RepID=UPI00235030F0|nr:HD domain-containing protein [Gilvibacter sediminis]MDC7996708.1 HD domain-containing protein [Gilvibacter sediminis]